jgi:hypothetical protein
MLELLNKAVLLLPVIVAVNVALAATGAVFDAIAKSKGQPDSAIGKAISGIAAAVKKVVDLFSANLPH